MKSPVPFLKPKSYYSSPFKTPVIKDEIVVQRDPSLPSIIETIVQETPVETEPLVEIEQPIEVEQPKPKKPKYNKPTEPEI